MGRLIGIGASSTNCRCRFQLIQLHYKYRLVFTFFSQDTDSFSLAVSGQLVLANGRDHISRATQRCALRLRDWLYPILSCFFFLKALDPSYEKFYSLFGFREGRVNLVSVGAQYRGGVIGYRSYMDGSTSVRDGERGVVQFGRDLTMERRRSLCETIWCRQSIVTQ